MYAGKTTNIGNIEALLAAMVQPPPTASEFRHEHGEIANGSPVQTITIPSGAYWVHVQNLGLAPITVNGSPLLGNGALTLESRYDRERNEIDYTPNIVITTSTSGVRWQAAYPQ